MIAAVLILAIIEICYWFVYVPKAWKNGSNRHLEDIKFYLHTTRRAAP